MPFSWLVASLFALGTAVDAARTLKKPNILLFFPDEWRYDWGGRCPHCCLLINISRYLVYLLISLLTYYILKLSTYMHT